MTTAPLNGIKVLDLSRILAGPSATQILGDFGADVIKVERAGSGDDTRQWGPPYVKNRDGGDSSESAYYISANRNKRSIALDFKDAEDLKLLKSLIAKADILVENFKVDTLQAYNLDYKSLAQSYPRLIYASLTGYGQTGPYAQKAGYDFMIQATGGIMSLTGPKEGPPFKTGVAIADLMAGQYMLNGILAALYFREKSGEGQHIDIALFDTQLAWLANCGQYYLTSDQNPPRVGNAHNAIVPYEAFETADGYMVLAVGNDRQFEKFCAIAGLKVLSKDQRFTTNPARVKNRDILLPHIRSAMKQHKTGWWLSNLEDSGVPCGPVNTVAEAFNHPQTAARGMTIKMPHPDTDTPLSMIANPVRFSKTPVTYRYAPPKCGADTKAVIEDWLNST